MRGPQEAPLVRHEGSVLEVLLVAGRLGLTSFGSPIAHIGYFRKEYVERRRWLDEEAFADLVALCQFLPGPASSQLGIAIGMRRAGGLGGIAAWLGFTVPSALLLVLFSIWLHRSAGALAPWLHGLMIVAVAVVAHAVLAMRRQLAPDRLRASFAFLSAIAVLLWPSAAAPILAIALGAGAGLIWLRPPVPQAPHGEPERFVGRRTGIWLLALFLLLLVGLPLLSSAAPSYPIALFDVFYRVGTLVFGGGHVVLPLLQSAVVPQGWVTNAQFLAGYGAAQAVPGPLFSFAAYLGAVSRVDPSGVLGAAIALIGIYLPSFLLVGGVLPFWDRLRRMPGARRALAGVNAAVVGVLLAALYHPVFTSAILHPSDLALALAAFLCLEYLRLPPWIVVMGTAVLAAAAGGGL